MPLLSLEEEVEMEISGQEMEGELSDDAYDALEEARGREGEISANKKRMFLARHHQMLLSA